MSLLPRSHGEFQKKDYWDSFFSKRSSPFEWYGEYQDLCHILHKYMKPTAKILVVGCGNSKLSEDLYDVGFHLIENIDISDVVIKQMSAKNRPKRPGMQFTKMDMLEMSYADEVFDCVIDKGTLDAIFSKGDEETVQKVQKMFGEVARVMRNAGRYVVVTLVQEHILKLLLQHFENGWLVRVHKVLLGDGEEAGRGLGSTLPVFVFVFTKMLRVEGRPAMKVFEYVDEGGKCVRCEGVEGVGEFVRASQQYAMAQHHLASLHVDEPFHLDLWSPDVNSEPRYTLHVLDQPRRKTKNGPFAIFIAPQGREMDWLFSSDAGRRQVADSAGFERLVIVTLHRGHTYQGGVGGVKEEVGGRVVELVQAGVPPGKQYPVLTLGDSLGQRSILCEDSSPLSGRFVVEESEGGDSGEGVMVRRLVFMSAPQLAQTEVRMVPVRKKQKSKKKKASHQLPEREPHRTQDHTYLCSNHHRATVASLVLVRDLCAPVANGNSGPKLTKKILLVGLGGGALPTYIHRHIPVVSLDVVELDPKMVEVAERWFGFPGRMVEERLAVHVGDGVEFIRQQCAAGRKECYHAVILDVDSKDSSAGMSSPPLVFVERELLRCIRDLLHPSGIFITNLVARNQDMRATVISAVTDTFPVLLNITVPQDVNELVVGLPVARDDIIPSPDSIPDATQPSGSLDSIKTGQSDASLVSDTMRLSRGAVRDSVAGLARTISISSGSLTVEDVETFLLEQLESAVVLR